VPQGVIQLAEGLHSLACEASCEAMVLWIGPKLNELPRLAGSDHRSLFVNWY
jgi:hypothetical protein